MSWLRGSLEQLRTRTPCYRSSPGGNSFIWKAPGPLRVARRDRGGRDDRAAALGHVDRVPALAVVLPAARRGTGRCRAPRACSRRGAARDLGPGRLVGAEGAREQREQLVAELVGVVDVDVGPAAGLGDAAQLLAHAVVDLEADDRDREVDAALGHALGGLAGIRRRAVVAAVGDEHDAALALGGAEVVRDGEQRAADRRPALALERVDRVASARPCPAGRPGPSARCRGSPRRARSR